VTQGWTTLRTLLPGRRTAIWFALATVLLLGTTSLVFLAYRAVGEWRRSTVLVVDQRSEEALTLLTVALNRDMKGVHHSVLASFNEGALDLDRQYELEALFAQAFARFPYPESFFVWRETPPHSSKTLIFNRVDRQPKWAGTRVTQEAYPVVSIADAPETSALVDQVRALGRTRQRFGAFDTVLGGDRYQVVVHLLYHTIGARQLFGAVGFTVNLDWVGENYFHEILQQISRIGHVEDSIALAVSDDRGRIVATTRPGVGATDILHERRFPLSFLDADLIGVSTGVQPSVPEWTLSVSAGDDRTLAAAAIGSSRTTWLIVLSAVVALMGVLFTLRALKASADLAEMQSEFVASATHELKTPLALFQLVAETLAKGRYQSEETIRAYGGMLAEQANLLERLIDNVLAYGSLSHVTRRYQFAPVRISELVESALERFDARLAATGREVKVDVSPDLPPIVADRASMLQVFDNVIDNAIKYSPQTEPLAVKAFVRDGAVHVEVSDRGAGIPPNERQRVFQKFYRGQSAAAGGSGLGLAIARRVVRDHGGRIAIRDAVPRGTTVAISLPLKAGRVHQPSPVKDPKTATDPQGLVR
jgi:signal transduction histidine kinase